MAGELEARFKRAVDYVQAQPGESTLGNSDKLKFYSLFKQATTGKCKGKQPSRLKIVARAKYDAWKGLGNMPKATAMKTYIAALEKVSPGWDKPKAKL
mmetsp:Transcript_3336/g.9052  ORF Transcript_3336/g.9052 Transcript_3336/m.9052 type:complete len:98 (+) Transcript_3336:194-487(+)